MHSSRTSASFDCGKKRKAYDEDLMPGGRLELFLDSAY